MELLAPAGGIESLVAGVDGGADAVYLGVGAFHARQFSDTIDDTKFAIDYAHLRGCKVYITLNTLITDKDISAWTADAGHAIECGADAVILQDLGGIDIIKTLCPSIPIHISTQATVHNSHGAQMYKDLGASRIVPARELTREQICKIIKNVDIELEVFVHGALCVCYSGQCLLSSLIGSRSANRGKCAQPCRLKYSLDGKTGHLLSAKDLCLAEEISALRSAGVHSLKIEGRMKNPAYVATVTRIYRKLIDGAAVTSADRDDLLLAFNRGGFTKGMFTRADGRLYAGRPDNIGLPAGNVVSRTKTTLAVATRRTFAVGDEIAPAKPDAKRQKIKSVKKIKTGYELTVQNPRAFDGEIRLVSRASGVPFQEKKIPIYAHVSIHEGSVTRLTLCTLEGIKSEVTGAIPERAINKSLTEDSVIKQLSKTGDTPFVLEKIDIDLSDGCALGVSAINDLRRRGLEQLSNAILQTFPAHDFAECRDIAPVITHKKPDFARPKLAVFVQTPAMLEAVEEFADIIYVPVNSTVHSHKPLVGVYPAITTDDELPALNAHAKRFDTVMSGGFVPGATVADTGFNICNSRSLSRLHGMGFDRVTLSRELNSAQISDLVIPRGCESEVVVYGRAPVMITEHCPVDCDRKKCIVANKYTTINSDDGRAFPVVHAGWGCRVTVFNCSALFMADKLSHVNADVLRLEFTVETPEECANIARMYSDAMNGQTVQNPLKDFTRGHFFRGFK